jgi:GNAT superfamily N-acetyltransferase
MTKADAPVISAAFTAQGWNKPVSLFTGYAQDGYEGKRTNLLAECAGQFAGYVTIVWESNYPPFHEAGIPEIVDFNVLLKFKRMGVGSALMDEAERRIGERSASAGLGVCIQSDYGAAQALYARRGYVPDGRGAFWKGKYVQYGDQVTIDDDLAIYMTKNLW